MEEPENPATMSASVAVSTRSADDDWSGRTLGEFQILRRIGRGGMGQVFLAEQKSLKRKVALKILRPELAGNPTALKRFKAEAVAVARLTHANIVQVYTIDEQDGIHYMALEYVEGRNLKDFLNRKGPPDLPAAISIMKQVAAALQRAGEQGFVHRDVKPENILVTRKGEVKVADFGLQRCLGETQQPLNLTQSGVAMGTPLYMSPEQVQGKPVDSRSDIYSFGVTCYHVLAGQPPFRGASAFDVALQHVQNEPPPLASIRPDLPLELCTLVHKMMAKNPDERYQNCKDVVRDLNRVRDSLSGAATMPMPPVNADILPIGSSATLAAPLVTAEFENFGTASIPSPPSRRWVPKIMIIVVLATLVVGGVTMRLMKERLLAKEPAKTQTNTSSVSDTQPVVSSEEKFLLEATRQFENPNTENLQELKKGLGFQIDLAVYYFKKNRLEDAEKFFHAISERRYKPMANQAEHPYQYFAHLGQALVLAFRDNADESLQQLSALIPTKVIYANPVVSVFRENVEFCHILADAINRNLKNLKLDRLPEKYSHLDAYRRPAEWKLPGRPFLGDKFKKS